MIKNQHAFFSLVFFLGVGVMASHMCRGANIIFDLNGVVCDVKRSSVIRYVGLYNFVRTVLSSFKNPADLFFNVMNRIEIPGEDEKRVCDELGKKLPKAMVYWQKGLISSGQIRQAVDKLLEENPFHFKNHVKKTMRLLVDAVYNPEVLVQFIKFDEKAVAFVQECLKRGHKIYVLSNFDVETFALFAEKNREFFDLFDGVVISGEVHHAKPEAQVYEYIVNKYNLDPATSLFIDDQKENIEGARVVGLPAFHYSKSKRSSGKAFDEILEILDSF